MSKTCRELKRPLDVTFVHAAPQLTPPAPRFLVIVTICYFALYHVLHAHREERKKTWLGSLIATVPQPPFPPFALNFLFFSFPYVFLFSFLSFPLPCSFLDLSEEIRRRRDARNSAMSNISKREWKVGCPKLIQNLWLNHVHCITSGDRSTLFDFIGINWSDRQWYFWYPLHKYSNM